MTNHTQPHPNGRALELLPTSQWDADKKSKVLLVAINTPGYYSLPVRILSLRAMTDNAIRQRYDVRFIEWENPLYARTDKADLEDLAAFINATEPLVVGFSMNIWNREACRQIAGDIKAGRPECCIIAGGQEVTNSVIDYLEAIPELDYIIDGEGERPFIEFLDALNPTSNRLPNPEKVSGLHYRSTIGSAFTGPAHVLQDLDDNPSIILAGMAPANEKDRLGVLLESSRGCPFRCSFCFEGAKREKLRSASVTRLCREIDHMVAAGSRYFHVMDPILCNNNLDRLAGLAAHFKKIRQQHGHLSISVETYADQITQSVAEHLQEFTMLDIGLQSTNPQTLQAIRRHFDKPKFIAGVERVNRAGTRTNIYLILGLPYETAASFFDGIQFATGCRPTQIFINELLLLNGTELRQRAQEYDYIFDPQPPYTVYGSKWLSPDLVILLKTIAKNIEHRYNLSNRNFAVPTPWQPTENRDDFHFEQTVLHSRCSLACSECRMAGGRPQAASGNSQSNTKQQPPVYEKAHNTNIDIVCGDDIPIAAIVQTAAQFKLAGALRIRLSTPAALFSQPQAAEKLINAGIYYFRTFLPAEDSPHRSAFDRAMGYFKAIRHHKLQIAGRKMSPHVEICMNGRFETLDQQLETAAKLGADYANLVSIADTVKPGDVAPPASDPHSQSCKTQRYKALINAAFKNHFAVKLSQSAAAAVFSESDGIQHILTSMDQMKMIYKEDKPPCWVSTSTAG